MKTSVGTLVILFVAVTGGTVIYLNRQKAPLIPAPVAELSPQQTKQTLPGQGWPAEMKTGPEVIQRLSNLIDQQETMTPRPQFARNHARLGD